MDLALNNLQRLICHKTKQTKPNQTNIYTYIYNIYINFVFQKRVDEEKSARKRREKRTKSTMHAGSISTEGGKFFYYNFRKAQHFFLRLLGFKILADREIHI